MSKPILCLDFDGVVHSYKSGWKGADVIPDPPVDNFFEWLEDVGEYFEIHIFSSRSNQPGGIEAMSSWFQEHWCISRAKRNSSIFNLDIKVLFPKEKPSAMISIDDRGLTFNGNWKDPQWQAENLLKFKPWNKR